MPLARGVLARKRDRADRLGERGVVER